VYKYVNKAETILKLFQCFNSALFHHVRTSEIKLQLCCRWSAETK